MCHCVSLWGRRSCKLRSPIDPKPPQLQVHQPQPYTIPGFHQVNSLSVSWSLRLLAAPGAECEVGGLRVSGLALRGQDSQLFNISFRDAKLGPSWPQTLDSTCRSRKYSGRLNPKNKKLTPESLPHPSAVVRTILRHRQSTPFLQTDHTSLAGI